MRLRRYVKRSDRDAEIASDIEAHLAMETEDNIARGMRPTDSTAAARRKFGNPALIREEIYRMHTLNFFETVKQDILYSRRILAHKPVFTAIVFITLALGIGANAAVFSIVNAVLLQPLPYNNPSRLVVIWDRNIRASGISKMFDSYGDFENLAQHATTLDQAAVATWAVNGRLLSGHGPTQDLLAVPVSASFFPLLGVAPVLGRTFLPSDRTKGCSVVLSNRLWRGQLAANPNLIGNSIALDDQPCTVVGVMPASFAFYPEATQLWILLTPNFSPAPDQLPVGIFARLRPGVTIAQAQAQVTTLHAALHRNDGKEKDIVPMVHDLREEFTFLAEAELKTTLLVLFGAVGFVLVMACLNVATLLLGQSVARERELSVRAALGCGRARLVRQLLTEGLVLGCAGGLLGICVAFVAVHYFRAVNPIEMPIGTHVEVDWPVLAFAAVISLVTSQLFGLMPAWKASRLDPIASLKTGGRGSIVSVPQRLMKGLVAAEIALSLILLAGGSLLLQSVMKMSSEPLGFRTEGLAVISIRLPEKYFPDAASCLRFYERLRANLGDAAAIATALPPNGLGANSSLHIAGKTSFGQSENQDVSQLTVASTYFNVLNIRLLRGRAFDTRDRSASPPVAIVNEAVAREYFPRKDPIGQSIRVGDPGDKNPWRTIVGLIANAKRSPNYHQVGWVERNEVLTPLEQDPPHSVLIAAPLSDAYLRSAITRADTRVALGDAETMQQRLGRSLAYPQFRALLLAAFAAFAVLLAAIGLYGVLRQFVAQRTQEIGVRMALGAQTADVLRLILRQASYPVFAGLAVGLLGAVTMGRFLATLLYGVGSADPLTFGLVALFLIAVAGLATFLPARRAAVIDPISALRNE